MRAYAEERLTVTCENSIALMETRFEALGAKGCLFCFNCLPTFLRIKLDWLRSLRCYRKRDDTPSSFDIEVGIMIESWNCCKAATLRSAFPTMRMLRHLGRR